MLLLSRVLLTNFVAFEMWNRMAAWEADLGLL
jgi:hypothetical protein